MIKALIGLILGVVVGYFFPISITGAYAKLFSVVLVVLLETIFGGLKAAQFLAIIQRS